MEEKIIDISSQLSGSAAEASFALKRTGFDAKGVTAEFDAIAKGITDEGASKFKNPLMRDAYILGMAKSNASVHESLAKYETAQVLDAAHKQVKRNVAVGSKNVYGDVELGLSAESVSHLANMQNVEECAAAYMAECDGNADNCKGDKEMLADVEKKRKAYQVECDSRREVYGRMHDEYVAGKLNEVRERFRAMHKQAYKEYRSLGLSENEANASASLAVANEYSDFVGRLTAGGKMTRDFADLLVKDAERPDANLVPKFAEVKDEKTGEVKSVQDGWEEGVYNSGGRIWLTTDQVRKLRDGITSSEEHEAKERERLDRIVIQQSKAMRGNVQTVARIAAESIYDNNGAMVVKGNEVTRGAILSECLKIADPLERDKAVKEVIATLDNAETKYGKCVAAAEQVNSAAEIERMAQWVVDGVGDDIAIRMSGGDGSDATIDRYNLLAQTIRSAQARNVKGVAGNKRMDELLAFAEKKQSDKMFREITDAFNEIGVKVSGVASASAISTVDDKTWKRMKAFGFTTDNPWWGTGDTLNYAAQIDAQAKKGGGEATLDDLIFEVPVEGKGTVKIAGSVLNQLINDSRFGLVAFGTRYADTDKGMFRDRIRRILIDAVYDKNIKDIEGKTNQLVIEAAQRVADVPASGTKRLTDEQMRMRFAFGSPVISAFDAWKQKRGLKDRKPSQMRGAAGTTSEGTNENEED